MNFLELNLDRSLSLEWLDAVSVWSTLIAATDAQAVNASSGNNLLQSLVEAIVLGLVQGVTEFLPISSTAHLLVFTKVLGWATLGQKYFVDAIQFGSVIAVVWYFWSDIRQILTGGWVALHQRDWEREEWKLLVGIAVGTIPALVGGLLLKDKLPESMVMIATLSIVMALLLGLAEQIGSRKRGFDSLQIKDGILVGLGQMFALFPGVSRSGSTLTTSLFLGLERQTAARFSFLLGLPTLTIATLYQARKAFGDINMLLPLLVGIVSTFIFSYVSIAWLLRYLQRQNTWVFVWYRLAFGLTILGAIATGWLRNN
ncbi:MAG TPA: undecaprenyl-diphosphatase [Cyanobacteria bacterium UBA8553]|nr:undecaprenyl-diphosphatase [Cyanobacteria bacterium UBA8553]HAJ61175.1 undecaprenyl-diphosphatase [Cyanobacteria bacterium UBA8543]